MCMYMGICMALWMKHAECATDRCACMYDLSPEDREEANQWITQMKQTENA